MNIREIAKLCGVSAATVSKVLHNDPSISDETRKKILEVTKQYHYIPYSSVLKDAVPNLNILAVAYDEQKKLHRALVYEIEKQAFLYGYNTVLYNANDAGNMRERYEKSLESKGVSGTIYLEEDMDVPGDKAAVILTSKRRLENTDQVASIRVSVPRAAEAAVSRLFDAGHRHIVCISGKNDAELFAAFEKVCRERMNEAPGKDTMIVYEPALVYELVTKIIAGNITALVAANRGLGERIYVELLKYGIRVPEQVSIVILEDCEKDTDGGLEFTQAAVRNKSIAKKLVDTLIDILENGKKGYAIGCMMEPEIIPGHTLSETDQNHFNEKIVVIGTINMDYNLLTESLPETGKTVRIGASMVLPGGKGANQAVGVGKLGGHVFLLGCLGNDQDGHVIYDQLQSAGVHLDGVTFHSEVPTGRAYIAIDGSGDSSISILNGANDFVTQSYINDHAALFDHAKYCLLNSELPMEIVSYAIRFCFERGIRVILKPAVIASLDDALCPMIDCLLPNRREAELLVPDVADIREKARILYDKGVKNVIITLGHNGCYLKNSEFEAYFPAMHVPAVDVTGASDAFISCLAVELCRGAKIRDAIETSTYAAGISVTQYGVQNSMIDRNSLKAYIDMKRKDLI